MKKLFSAVIAAAFAFAPVTALAVDSPTNTNPNGVEVKFGPDTAEIIGEGAADMQADLVAGKKIYVEVKVEAAKEATAEAKAAAEKVVGKGDKAVTYDVKVTYNGKSITNLGGGTVQFNLKTPEDFKALVGVVHATDNEKVNATVSGSNIVCTYGEFSPFTVVYNVKPNSKTVKTGDSSNALPYILMMIGAVAVVAGAGFTLASRKN